MRYRMTVRDEPPRRLLALEHRGPYPGIAGTFDSLFATFLACNRPDQVQAVIGIFPHDPKAVRPATLRSLAAIAVATDTPRPDGLEDIALPGGPTAVLRFQGPYSFIPAAYEWLHGLWLPASGRRPAKALPYEIYVNSPRDTAPLDLLTDICVPLR
jgi:AraC family transcriptional regulator